MTIKLDRFCLLLNDAKEESCVDDSGVSRYLLNNLLYPFLDGADIKLGDLDYDAFELHEMDGLYGFISEMQYACQKTGAKTDKLLKSVPAARPRRAFC